MVPCFQPYLPFLTSSSLLLGFPASVWVPPDPPLPGARDVFPSFCCSGPPWLAVSLHPPRLSPLYQHLPVLCLSCRALWPLCLPTVLSCSRYRLGCQRWRLLPVPWPPPFFSSPFTIIGSRIFFLPAFVLIALSFGGKRLLWAACAGCIRMRMEQLYEVLVPFKLGEGWGEYLFNWGMDGGVGTPTSLALGLITTYHRRGLGLLFYYVSEMGWGCYSIMCRK